MINNTEAIWHELHHDLGQFIGRRISDADAADDILQDVFLKIHAQTSTLRDDQKLVSWAYQIARNAIVDYYRTQRQHIELPESLTEVEAEDGDLSNEFAPCIRRYVENLPRKYRDVLLLTEYQGLTLQQAADKLNLSLSGVKSRVQRAREIIKGMLLQCCHFEFDRRGHMIDYYPYRPQCNDAQSNCQSDGRSQLIELSQIA